MPDLIRADAWSSDPMASAFDALLATTMERAAWLRAHPFFADERNRPGAYMFLLSMLLARIEEEVIHDPDFPSFRILDTRVREGGDNPDQRYLICRINGGDEYRIWGRVAGERRVEVQTYAGDPYIAGSGGRSAGFLAHEDLVVEADGTFEVILSPDPRPGNWVSNPADGTRVLVRQVYGAWSDEAIGEVHIDRVGHEGDLAPRLTAQALTARLSRAVASLDTHAGLWPEMVRTRYVERLAPNTISRPIDPGALGGASGRFMAFGTWNLADDEALLITTWPMSGNYQGIQLADMWWSSLEYANRQTSLTGEQSAPSPDGSFTYVVSVGDPGVANWLDTTGLPRGIIMLRFDGTTEPVFDPARYPTARVIPVDGIHAAIGETSRYTPTQPRATIARRRRHVQRRFGV